MLRSVERVIGTVCEVLRFPVKSMAGERLAAAQLGWHGLEGDRRFAFLRADDAGGFAWLTAGKLPTLVRYRPVLDRGADPMAPPSHVVTPEDERLELTGEALRRELSAAHGHAVRLLHLDRGIFDDAAVSVLATPTIAELARCAGRALDARRFRPNLLIEPTDGAPFQEDAWVGRVLAFGGGAAAPAITITHRDLRCAMINLDPETGTADPAVMKAAVRANENFAGVYGATLRPGLISVGDVVRLVEP